MPEPKAEMPDRLSDLLAKFSGEDTGNTSVQDAVLVDDGGEDDDDSNVMRFRTRRTSEDDDEPRGRRRARAEEEDDEDDIDDDEEDLDDDDEDFDDDDYDDDDEEEDEEPRGRRRSKDDDDEVIVFSLDDGEDVEVSVEDLYQAYENREVAEQRRAELDVLHTKAQDRVHQAQQDYTQIQGVITNLFGEINKVLHIPLATEPDIKLKTTNPQVYVEQLDAWNADQDRIAQSKDSLMKALQKLSETQENALKKQRIDTVQILRERIPDLASSDKKVSQKAASRILNSAKHYGFTEKEVQAAVDHRIFLMAYDAERYRELKEQSGKPRVRRKKAVDEAAKANKSRRLLRSKGNSSRKRLNSDKRKEKQRLEKARNSGKVGDIAATLITGTKR